MKLLLKHIKWITGLLVAVLILLLIIAVWRGNLSFIIKMIILPVVALIAIFLAIGSIEYRKKKFREKSPEGC